jgi:hypothetical protein
MGAENKAATGVNTKPESSWQTLMIIALEEMEPLANGIHRSSIFSHFHKGVLWALHSLPNLFGLLQWVNVYTVKRAFGSREAGGWYYRRYTCEESRLVWFWEAKGLQKKLLKRFSGLIWGVITSESVGQEVTVLIEQRKEAQQFLDKPIYDPERVTKQRGFLSPTINQLLVTFHW